MDVSGFELAALFYLATVPLLVIGGVLCWRQEKYAHVAALALLAMTIARLAAGNLMRAGHAVPAWVRQEGVIALNAALLFLILVAVLIEGWLDRQERS